jgi:hypothetical protein
MVAPEYAAAFEDWLRKNRDSAVSRECAPTPSSAPCIDARALLSRAGAADAFEVMELTDDAGVPCVFVLPTVRFAGDPETVKATAALSDAETFVTRVRAGTTRAARAVSAALASNASVRGVVRVSSAAGGGFVAVRLPPSSHALERGLALLSDTFAPPPRALWAWTLQLLHALAAVDAAVREETRQWSTSFCWNVPATLQLVLQPFRNADPSLDRAPERNLRDPSRDTASLDLTLAAPALYADFFDPRVSDDVRAHYFTCVCQGSAEGALRETSRTVDATLLGDSLAWPLEYGQLALAGLWGVAPEAAEGATKRAALQWACTAFTEAVNRRSGAVPPADMPALTAWRTAIQTALSEISWTSAAYTLAIACGEHLARSRPHSLPEDASHVVLAAVASDARPRAVAWRADPANAWAVDLAQKHMADVRARKAAALREYEERVAADAAAARRRTDMAETAADAHAWTRAKEQARRDVVLADTGGYGVLPPERWSVLQPLIDARARALNDEYLLRTYGAARLAQRRKEEEQRERQRAQGARARQVFDRVQSPAAPPWPVASVMPRGLGVGMGVRLGAAALAPAAPAPAAPAAPVPAPPGAEWSQGDWDDL